MAKCLLISMILPVCLSNFPCLSREIGVDDEGEKAVVCVCNDIYCDTFDAIGRISPDEVHIYRSSLSGKRFEKTILNYQSSSPDHFERITVNSEVKKQKIIGFGGAFTDAAALVLSGLSERTRARFMESYFGENGIDYTVGRIPIASCDFSTHEYSYDEVEGDLELDHWALTEDDTKYKIPMILKAINMSRGLKLFGSPWSPPGWMKESGRMKGGSPLKGPVNGKYYSSFATYIVKFIEAYESSGIPIWAITPANEPENGMAVDFRWQVLNLTADEERDFLRDHLGPKMKNSKLASATEIIIMDDQRTHIEKWANTILSDPKAAQFVSGIGVHWYQNDLISPDVLSRVHLQHPQFYIFATEACNGDNPKTGPIGPVPGSWERGNRYAKDIILNLNNWVTGWMDWNLLLDMEGGPNWVNNVVDAPVLADSSKDEFYKNPMYYVMGHFSKFIRPGDFVVNFTSPSSEILFTSTIDANGRRTVVILNENKKKSLDISIEDVVMKGKFINVHLEPRSIATLVYVVGNGNEMGTLALLFSPILTVFSFILYVNV